MSRSLVTHALPYANGSIHLGHLVESVQTDIFVRARKAMGNECVFICADDTHGTPIEISSRKAGVPPEEYIAKIHEEHAADYKAFNIGFDLFYSTHSPENEKYSVLIFEELRKRGDIEQRGVEQMYCGVDKRFLPDRYIRGICPVCATPDQYGDNCENCGSAYEPTALKSPHCAICGNDKLERRTSMHYFVKLGNHQEWLREWTSTPGRLQEEILNSLGKWLNEPLRDWDISRDAPYFGFKIPGEDAKYFYVWLDAPVGYLSTTEKWCELQSPPRKVEEFWGADAPGEVIHFIGKDIVYFHTLFWPAMLKGSGWKVPARVHVHGMLTVEGAKMSKSRGTFINASEYTAAGLDPEWLRFFYAANLGPTPSDIDLSLNDFKNRVNGELLNNVGNLANRALSLIWKNGGKLGSMPKDAQANFSGIEDREARIRGFYDKCDTRAVINEVLEFASWGNQHLQNKKPWELFKSDKDAALWELTVAANVARFCARWLEPIVPKFAGGVAAQLNAPLGPWGNFDWLQNHQLTEPKPLVRKIEETDIAKLAAKFVGPSESPVSPGARGPETAKPVEVEPAAPPVNIEQFALVDLRAGKVLSAEKVPKKDKLIKMAIDLGEGQPRSIVSGVALSYKPEELVGKVVCVVANLPPRDFGKGLVSHGMVLYSGGGTREHTVLELPADIAPGAKVK
ncbi:MAG TPA: methionine--tRNA ligase [Myxococcales bacterium]|nr:methionine--tRNA ligase [Myxococcales bacterium]